MIQSKFYVHNSQPITSSLVDNDYKNYKLLDRTSWNSRKNDSDQIFQNNPSHISIAKALPMSSNTMPIVITLNQNTSFYINPIGDQVKFMFLS